MKFDTEKLIQIAIAAGEEILDVYNQTGADQVEQKVDGSPLTQADQRAHHCIANALSALTPAYPVMSEESKKMDVADRQSWPIYWLVDPLDGTKEFIKRNGEFTVNIALMENNQPIWGIVYVPVSGAVYYGGKEYGAYKQQGLDAPQAIKVRTAPKGELAVLASRSHVDTKLDALYQLFADEKITVENKNCGSSIKFCMIAQGSADVYPRLGLTSEWDTGAAQAVLEGAGGNILRFDGQRLDYNKSDVLNPYFLATGDIEESLKTKIMACCLAQGL